MIRDTIKARIAKNMVRDTTRSRLFSIWFKRWLDLQSDRFDKSSLAMIE
jgi:hypothetical protein